MQRDGVVRGGKASGQTQIDVILGFEELIGLLVDFRQLILDIQNVRDGVFAGVARRAPGQTDPV